MSSTAKLIREKLARRFSGDLLWDECSLALYSNDASIYQVKPEAVSFPRSRDDLLALVDLAVREGIPLTPRGGGSGLCGGALGRGIIVDFSRYLNRVEALDAEAQWVRAEPGIVLDDLNSRLAASGLMLGPDPASSARCTLGGMISHNSSGAHSLKYGDTRQAILALDVLLSDGSIVTFDGWDGKDRPPRTAFLEGVARLLGGHEKLIDRGYPETSRNSAGYLLRDVFRGDRLRPALLFAASEGTLGFILSATMNAVTIPPARALVVVCFENVVSAAAAVPEILSHSPAAIEMLDSYLHRAAAEHVPGFGALFPPDAGASLVIAFTGAQTGDLQRVINGFTRRFFPAGERKKDRKIILDPDEQAMVWKTRKAAVPLLARHEGRERPIPFIEDTAVPPEKLADLVKGIDYILKKNHIRYAAYAHAGAGELHFRPFMIMDTPEGRETFSTICDEVFSLVLSLGGTVAGEHGAGLARSGYLEKQYGPLVPLFRAVKKHFDPPGVMNPHGPFVEDGESETAPLRPLLTGGGPHGREALFAGRAGLMEDLIRCDGCALCKSTGEGQRMCPVYHALNTEEASPRGKNILFQHYAAGTLSGEAVLSKRFRDILGLCLNCGMCSLECPACLDTSAMTALARRHVAGERGRALLHPVFRQLIARAESAAAMPGIVNFLPALPGMRRVMAWIAGYDRGAPLPKFRKPVAAGTEEAAGAGAPDFICFLDTFCNCFDDRAAGVIVRLAERAGERPVFPDQRGSGLPLINAGDLETALDLCRENLEQIGRAGSESLPVVVPEPSAVLALREEYPLLIKDEAAAAVAKRIAEACRYFEEKIASGRLGRGSHRETLKAAYHMPCHLKLIDADSAGLRLLRDIRNIRAVPVERGCCGLGGTFGLRQGNFEISQRIGAPLFEAILEEKPDVIATECSACRMQLEAATGIPAVHPLELLADGIR
jgi:FAD/FMN-containing dehydrogenase/Fe-S oxidoreductase